MVETLSLQSFSSTSANGDSSKQEKMSNSNTTTQETPLPPAHSSSTSIPPSSSQSPHDTPINSPIQSTPPPKSTFLSLPPEIHLLLIPFLPWPTLTSLRLTCHYFATILLTPNTSSTTTLFLHKRPKNTKSEQLTPRARNRQTIPPPLILAPHLLQLCILHLQCSRAVSDEETTRLHATLNITNSNWTGLTQGWWWDDHNKSSFVSGSSSTEIKTKKDKDGENEDENDDVARLPCYNCLRWKRAVGPLKSSRISQGQPDPRVWPSTPRSKSTSKSSPTITQSTFLPTNSKLESHFAQSMTLRTHDLGKRRRLERICIPCGLRSHFYRKGSSPRTQAVCWLCEENLCSKVVKQWTGKIGQRECIVSPVRARDAFFCVGCVSAAAAAEIAAEGDGEGRVGKVVIVEEGERGWIPGSWVEFGHWRKWGRYEGGLRRGKKYRDEKGVIIRRERGILDYNSRGGSNNGTSRARNLHWCPVMQDERMCGCRHETQGMMLEERKDWPW